MYPALWTILGEIQDLTLSSHGASLVKVRDVSMSVFVKVKEMSGLWRLETLYK